MLTGVFKYKGHVYSLEGYDFGDNVNLRLYPAMIKDKLFLDSGIHYSDGNVDMPGWESLWCSVGLGFIKVDCYISEDEGNVVKNAVNRDLFVALGQIIRGMKAGCNSSNMVFDGDLYHTDFNPRDILTFEYPTGTISTKLQLIQTLKYVKDDIELELEDDYIYSKQVFADNKSPHKFKLDLSEFVTSMIADGDDDWDFGDDKIFSLQEIIERNPDKDYVWLKGRKYYIVKGQVMLERVCKYLWQFDLLAFDTETTGLKFNVTCKRGEGDRLVGMIFSGEPGIAYYFPIAHKKIENLCTPGEEYAFIEKYFKPLLEKKKIVCHNGAFDWKVMYVYDICINLTEDTYILFKVTMGGNNPQLELSLKKLTKTFLNRDSFELKDFVNGRFGVNVKFWDLPEESVKYYACPDTDNLIELLEYTRKVGLLEEYDAKKVYEIEVLFSIVIAYQEFYGHCVDMSKRDKLVADIISSKEEAYKKMVEMVGHDFNPKSSKDLPKVMFEELGYPVISYTAKGAPSTNKETKEKLMSELNLDGSPKYPFVHYLQEYLDAKTMESNFTNKISELATEDGLFFSEVQQFLETGRVSTSNPNYQGYSKVVKKYVIPRNGYYSIDADYSTVEARIMCSMAGCKAMVEKLKNPDTDYHRQKAADMFSVPYELVTDDLRQMSKGVNFGILYGLGDPNLGAKLFGVKSPANTKRAAHQKELYYKGMEELKPFTEESRAQGVTQGFSTTFFRRRRWYNLATTRRDTIERRSCNARIQGTAADLYKLGMVRLFLKIKKKGWLGKLLISAFVHDECFTEVSKSINPFEALQVIRESMMIDIEGWCPLFTGMGFGDTWYEAKGTEIPVQVQELLINKYAEHCPEWWDGDTRKLCDFVVNEINTYNASRVLNYLKDENNWGKVLMPTENKLLHGVLKNIRKGVKYDGMVCDDAVVSDDVRESVSSFLRCFGADYLIDNVDIQELKATNVALPSAPVEKVEDVVDIDPCEALKMRVGSMGVVQSSDGDGKKLYIRMDENPVFMGIVKKTLETHSGGNIEVRTFKDGQEYKVGISVDAQAYPKLLQLYLSARNMNRRVNA